MKHEVDSNLDGSQSLRIGRVAAVLAGGVYEGGLETIDRVSHDPTMVLRDAMLGVATSAILNKVKPLRLPAVAISAVCGVDLSIRTMRELVDMGPLFRDLWNEPVAYTQTQRQLTKRIGSLTADLGTAGVSFLLTNRGFKALSDASGNSAAARTVLGREPVSFLNPRHRFKINESGVQELELLPFSLKEQAKLISYKSEILDYTAYSQRPFKTVAEANMKGARTFSEPTRIYSIAGADTKVLIPESLDKRLDEVRHLSRAMEDPFLFLQPGRRRAIKSELEANPFSKMAKPEDILTSLSMLPDSRIVSRVELSPYALNIFRPNLVSKDRAPSILERMNKNITGLSNTKDAVIFLRIPRTRPLEPGQPPTATNVLRHEWAHLALNADEAHRRAFFSAAMIERMGFNKRKYATVNTEENRAVHLGEGLISPSASQFQETARFAPLRTSVLAKGLEGMLSRVPVEERGLFHKYYSDRLRWLEGEVKPGAVKLLKNLNPNSDVVKKDVSTILDYLQS